MSLAPSMSNCMCQQNDFTTPSSSMGAGHHKLPCFDIALAGSMEADDCPFSKLPQQFRDPFLIQAFQQLGQQHQLQVLPLVCHAFHQLAPSSISTITAKLGSKEAANSFISWLLSRGAAARILHISAGVHLPPGPTAPSSVSRLWSVDQLLGAVGQLLSLQELHLKHSCVAVTGIPPFTPVSTQLRGLSLRGFRIPVGTAQSLLQLSRLTSLDLTDSVYSAARDPRNDLIAALASSLKSLRSLQMALTPNTPLDSVRALSGLTGLKHLVLTGLKCRPADLPQQLQHVPLSNLDLMVTAASEVEPICNWVETSGRSLRKLIIKGPAINTVDMAQTKRLFTFLGRSAVRLQHFTLHGFDILGAEAVAALGSLTGLEGLSFHEGCFDAVAVAGLSVLSGLTALSLQGSLWNRSSGQGYGLGQLACLTRLRDLYLGAPLEAVREVRLALAGRVMAVGRDPSLVVTGVRFKLGSYDLSRR